MKNLRHKAVGFAFLPLVSIALAACGASARYPVSTGFGPNPVLPPPHRSLIPTVHVVDATGWPEGATPDSAEGTTVRAFATGLDHPRWLHVLPNGDVLVAETNTPPRPDYATGIKGWFMKRLQKKAGSTGPSANRITLLRDDDGDGVAEQRSVLLAGLNSPFGMALVDDTLYVASTDAVVRVPYEVGQTEITATPVKVIDLPAGRINQHWTRSLLASADGTRLYVGVGSASNVAEHGFDEEEGRAAVWEIDVEAGTHRVLASGLRNPVGMAWEPRTGALWVAVNERDALGSDLVPDYMTAIVDGGFYGWPYSYFGSIVDPEITPQRLDLVQKALVPDYALGAHTASLGLAHSRGTALPETFREGMFVGQRGSWNRKPRSGYKVIFVPFTDGVPSGSPIDLLTGFVSADGKAWGRPVGVAVDGQGALLVADDVGNTIWRVEATAPYTSGHAVSSRR